ncbi:MAG: DUF1428 domain-containing protein [Gammaproteobacteria bacterium]|nr:DUF1428 domain-containing protein [Gammaproteobacteria bacterium]
MANYIDGFVLPIPKDKLNNYQQVVEQVAEVWKEHGALDYQEFVGDDLSLEGVRSFVETANAKPDEVVIFGWVTFESKEARDLANEKVANDPRMTEIMESSDDGFDATRMAYGGFKPLV